MLVEEASIERSPALVRSSILREFAGQARALELDVSALMKRADIDPALLADPDLTLPMRKIVELFELTAMSSGVEDFGLRVAESRTFLDLGPAILVLHEQPTVRSGLNAMFALLHLHSDALYMHLEDGETPIYVLDLIVDGVAHYRQAMDTCVGSGVRLMRWLLGEQWLPAMVCFRHSPPATAQRYQSFFKCPLAFLQDVNGVVLNAGDLDQRIQATSETTARQVERYIRSIDTAPSGTYLHRVKQVIAMTLPQGGASADRVAKLLGTSPRTMNKRLAKAGVNFSDALGDVRRTIAIQCVRDGERPLSDIAGLVGFESLSAFTRWFQRSFGEAPSRLRGRATGTRSRA